MEKPFKKPDIYDPGKTPFKNQRMFYNTLNPGLTLRQLQWKCENENKNIEIKRYNNQLLLLRTSRN